MARKRQNKSQAKWIILLGVVLVFLVGLGLLKNNGFQPQPKEGAYQVYKNSVFGFRIEYPNNWEIRKNTHVFENGDAIAFRKTGPTQKKYTELSDGAQLAVSKPFSINTDLATWMKSYFSPQAKFSKLPLSNYTFEAVEECGYMECMRYYFTKINSQIYGIALYADGTSTEKAAYENALIYMLKSFQIPNIAKVEISKEKAVTRVKALPEVLDYLKRVHNGQVMVNGEENNTYMVQVYEFKDNHTATFNWYSVNKTTGEVKKEF